MSNLTIALETLTNLEIWLGLLSIIFSFVAIIIAAIICFVLICKGIQFVFTKMIKLIRSVEFFKRFKSPVKKDVS